MPEAYPEGRGNRSATPIVWCVIPPRESLNDSCDLALVRSSGNENSRRSQSGFTSQLSFVVTPVRRVVRRERVIHGIGESEMTLALLNRLSTIGDDTNVERIYRPFGK